MCIIIDANRIGDFCNKDNEDLQPVREWMKNGRQNKIAYSPHPTIEKELRYNTNFNTIFKEWRRSDKVKSIDSKKIEAKITELKTQNLRSNDLHILALAELAKVNLLVTQDENLIKDFKDIYRNKGKIYKGKKSLDRNPSLLQDIRCP